MEANRKSQKSLTKAEQNLVDEVAAEIHGEQIQMDQSQFDDKLRLGKKVLKVMGEHGKKLVPALAAKTGKSKSSLYAAANFASQFTAEAINEIREQAKNKGSKVTVSQLMLIAGKKMDDAPKKAAVNWLLENTRTIAEVKQEYYCSSPKGPAKTEAHQLAKGVDRLKKKVEALLPKQGAKELAVVQQAVHDLSKLLDDRVAALNESPTDGRPLDLAA